MNPARRSLRTTRARLPVERGALGLAVVAACIAALPLSGCRQGRPAGPTSPVAKDERQLPTEGVTLSPEQIARAGIKTMTLAAASRAPESTGYAVVITHEAIAQALADLTGAAAIERQSRAAVLRARSLAGTPGAMPVQTQEAAERQATVDHAAFVFSQQRLSATYGQNAPWKASYHNPTLASLARGTTQLVRATFPLGALGPSIPAGLRLTHIGPSQSTRSIVTLVVWSAPADSSIPGKSLFAILKGGDANEGERLIAHAAVGAAESGVVVPYAAVVISAGTYWCYIVQQPGVFVRTAVDPGIPTDEGYFVRQGIAVGAEVVTTSAGQLLARETNPGSAPD